MNGTSFGPAISAPAGSLGNTLIPIGDLAQRIGFFMGVIDGALDGTYYGSSLIHRYSGCKSPSQRYAQLSLIPGLPFLLPAQTGIIQNWKVDAAEKFGGGPGGIVINGPNSELLTVACAVKQIFGVFPTLPDASFSYKVCWYPSMSPVRQNYSGMGYTIDGTGVFYGQDIIRHAVDQVLVCEVTKTEGVLYLDLGFFTATGGAVQANLSLFSCGAKADSSS
jgi:hypothetical protein